MDTATIDALQKVINDHNAMEALMKSGPDPSYEESLLDLAQEVLPTDDKDEISLFVSASLKNRLTTEREPNFAKENDKGGNSEDSEEEEGYKFCVMRVDNSGSSMLLIEGDAAPDCRTAFVYMRDHLTKMRPKATPAMHAQYRPAQPQQRNQQWSDRQGSRTELSYSRATSATPKQSHRTPNPISSPLPLPPTVPSQAIPQAGPRLYGYGSPHNKVNTYQNFAPHYYQTPQQPPQYVNPTFAWAQQSMPSFWQPTFAPDGSLGYQGFGYPTGARNSSPYTYPYNLQR